MFFVYGIPSVIGICVFSLYTLVDAIFVSKICGENALAAVEICAPILNIFSCFSIIIGVGGNTLIGIELGKTHTYKASSIFSLSTTLIVVLSLIFTFLLLFFTRPIAFFLGADEIVIDFVCDYLAVCGCFAPFYLLNGFLSLCSETIGKPLFAMIGNITMALGNIALDCFFVLKLDLGVFGASLASGLSALLATVVFFIGLNEKNSVLKFKKFNFDLLVIKQIIYNGFSDGLTTASGGIVTFIYNWLIMKNCGSETLACYTAILTVINFLGSIIIGAAQGINPIISFNYGANNFKRIKKAIKFFIGIEIVIAIAISFIFMMLHSNIIALFGVNDKELSFTIAKAYVPVFILTPLCALIISSFTAINDAKTSAVLSFMRSIVFRVLVVFIFYILGGIDGVWFGSSVSEFISIIMCIFVIKKSKIW